MLKIQNVSKIYSSNKVQALNNVNYSFSDVGLYYIVGPSGSGKSTLIKLIGGMDKEFEGDISIDGIDIKNLNESQLCEYRKNVISLAFQSHELEKEFSIYENVDDILSLVVRNKKERKKRIKNILEQLGLFKIRKKNVNKLSGGERARVSLARALVKESKIYLLDEPLNGLNKSLRIKVTELLKQISKKHLVIVVTHQKDEITSNCTVCSITDGVLKEEKGNENIKEYICENKNIEKKEKFSFVRLTRRTIKKIFYNKFRAFCTSLTIMVSLISFGLAILISSGVVKEIENALTSNIVDNAIALEKRSYDFITDEKKNIDEISFEKVRIITKDLFQDYGHTYIGEINNLFPNDHRLILSVNNKNIFIPTLTADKLFSVKNPYEVQTQVNIKDLTFDEVILGVTFEQYKILFSRTTVDNNLCEKNYITLNLKLENKQWEYDADVLFVVKQVVITEELVLLHTNNGFLDHLIQEELELEVNDNLESSNILPWTMKRQSYLIIKQGKKKEFIKRFYNDTRFNEFDLITFGSSFPYRFGIIQRVNERLDIGEVKTMAEKFGNVYSYSYSSPFYQFGDEGLYAGFDNPFYISAEKYKINELIDNYCITESPVLTSFNIISPDNVIGGDLLGSMNNDCFIFETISEEENIDDGVIISSGLAEYLNIDISLSNKIHYAYLYSTKQIDDKYSHTFKTGYFEVKQIRDEKKYKIYQDPFFLIQLGLIELNNDEAGNYYKALLRFSVTEEELIAIKESLQKDYPDYYFSLPGEKVKTSISPTINLIKDILYALSFFSFLIASFLLTYTLLLVVIEDKRSIKTKYSLGYSKKDLIIEYGFMSIFYSLIPGFSSAFLIYFIQIVFSKSLSVIMNTSSLSLSVLPSFVVLILSILIGFISVIFTTLNIYKMFGNSRKYSLYEKINKYKVKLLNQFSPNQ